jgi:HEAT repeat protein
LKRQGTRASCLALALTLSGGVVRAEVTPPAATPTATAKAKAKLTKSKGGTPASAAMPAARLESLRLVLAGADDGAAIDAAGALGTSGAAAAREPLVELLASGATPARAEAALDALAKLSDAHLLGKDETTLDVIELYAGHRAPELRRRAIKVLGGMADPRVVPTLMERLGDAAPDVRAAAAEALAARREGKALGRMFARLKAGDAGVASPLATIATPDLVPQIAELAGTMDDGIIASALGEYVKRTDVPDRLRVDVLRTIGRLSGAAATTALVEYVASVPAKDDRPSKHEAQKLLDQRGADQ